MHTLTSLLELASTPDGLQQIRVMVAELEGWKPCHKGCEGKTWRKPDDSGCQPFLPDFDLNACAALRKGLNMAEQELYADNLKRILGTYSTFDLIDATPVQHCVAFILMRQDQPTKGAEQ